MNYGKYDTICCKCDIYLLICNELSCINPGNNNKYNEYNYNSAAIEFQCNLNRSFFTCTIYDFSAFTINGPFNLNKINAKDLRPTRCLKHLIKLIKETNCRGHSS